MNKEIWSKAEENVKLLSEDDKKKKAKQQKEGHIAILAGFGVFVFFAFALGIVCLILGEIGIGIMSIVIALLGSIYPIFVLKDTVKKDTNYFATLNEYSSLMRNQSQTKINATKTIKEVVLLDARTVVTDKLHAVLNWQEIKQTRVYSFKITYEDNTEQILNVEEGSKDYLFLISKVKQPSVKEQKSNTEKIREYKKLLDDGIITQEDFDKKKNELLNKD